VQMIGRSKAKVPKTISIDLGVTDIYVTDRGRHIEFGGGGLGTNVGKRIESPTKGMSIPKEYAPAGLREYEEVELGVEEEPESRVHKDKRLIPREALPEVMRVF